MDERGIMKFYCEKARLDDMKNVFELSNDPLVRRMSTNTDKIIWEKHVTWFNKKIKDKNSEFYVVKNNDNEFIGQVRFDTNNNETIVSISLVEKYRGKKNAKNILNNCMKKSKYKIFTAYIKPENIPSIRTFASLGYEYQTDVVINNIHLKKYIYNNI